MKQDHCIITVMNAKSMLHFKVLNYTLIAIDENEMQSKGVKSILADSSRLPVVQPYDEVYMIHHPEKMKKNFSQDKARRVIGPYIVYLANTLEGPPGSPVFVFKESKFLLIAMHSGPCRIEGVLVSDILDNLHMGKGKTCFFLRFPAFNCKSGKIICQVEPCVCGRSFGYASNKCTGQRTCFWFSVIDSGLTKKDACCCISVSYYFVSHCVALTTRQNSETSNQ